MNLTIDYDNKIASTDVGAKDNLDTDRLNSILYDGAFSNNIKHISIINSFFIGRKILKAVKVCLTREIDVSINGKDVDSWDALMPYQSDITEYAMKKEAEAMSDEVYNIIIHNKELIHPFSEGINVLHSFLDTYIYASKYDVSMSSTSSYDTKSCGIYEDRQGHKHEFSRNYTKRKPSSYVSLYDKLQMYINCKYYQSVGIKTETDGINRDDVDSYTGGNLATASVNALTWTARHDYGMVIDFETASTLCRIHNMAIDEPFIKDKDEVVVPISACDINTEYQVMMSLYGEYADE